VDSPTHILLHLKPTKKTFNITLGRSRIDVHFAITHTSPFTMNFSVRPWKTEGESSTQPLKSLTDLGYKPYIPSSATMKNLFSIETSVTLEVGSNCEMDLAFDSAIEIIIR